MSSTEAKRTVLVVEDEPAIRLAVHDAIEQSGYAVEVAVDGDTAFAMAMGRSYDLIVPDIMLPGLSGLEICRRLRAAGRRMPILMLTARGGENDRIEGLRGDRGPARQPPVVRAFIFTHFPRARR